MLHSCSPAAHAYGLAVSAVSLLAFFALRSLSTTWPGRPNSSFTSFQRRRASSIITVTEQDIADTETLLQDLATTSQTRNPDGIQINFQDIGIQIKYNPTLCTCSSSSCRINHHTFDVQDASFLEILEHLYGRVAGVPSATFVNQNEYTWNTMLCIRSATQRGEISNDALPLPAFTLELHGMQGLRVDLKGRASGACQDLIFAGEAPNQFDDNTGTYGGPRSPSCTVIIPYVTGIYDPRLWTTARSRGTLLLFVGGTWRGPKNGRSHLVNGLLALAQRNRSLFSAPLVIQNHTAEGRAGWAKGTVSTRSKEAYMNSVFSLQPPGDSPTRRGFYEALLLGNIPVVPSTSFATYSLVSQHMAHMCVVLPDEDFWNPHKVFAYVRSISSESTRLKQAAIAKWAGELSWKVDGKQNAWKQMAAALRSHIH